MTLIRPAAVWTWDMKERPAHFGRGYFGGWETRNLQMASNIRNMFATQPGIRGLVVGDSHRPT